MALKHAFVSSAPEGSDPSKVRTSNWNADHAIDTDGVVIPVHATLPTAPTADNLRAFVKNHGNTRPMLTSMGPSGMDYPLQPSMWRQKIARVTAWGNSNSAPSYDGIAAMTANVATLTARNVATTNLFTRMRRLGYVSNAATAGLVVGLRGTAAQWVPGNGSGQGGFFASFRFGFSDAAAVAGVRAFMGMSSSTAAPTNVEPNTLTNSFGIAQLSTASDRLYLVYGGSAAQTAVDLGTGFPPYNGAVGTTTGVPYDFTIWCPPNGNGVFAWQLDRLDTGTKTGGTVTPGTPGTQTPSNTTYLTPQLWRSNNATALACAFDLIGLYFESDY